MNRRAVLLALLSAAFFGVSTPAAKLLLGTVDPAVLAGLLYCGAGLGIAAVRRTGLFAISKTVPAEATLGRKDVPYLAGAIVAGGVVGPVLLMTGLQRTDASAASLLLTLEGVATALMAWFIFHENFDRRIALGMACIAGGALVLSWTGQPQLSGLLGTLAIVGACVAWGLDNNLTRKVSLSDPLQIVELKGLIAGPANLTLGLLAGGQLPGLEASLLATLVGFLGYGVSLVLFVYALRHLGSARTGAYFSTAPFLGAIAALAILQEPLTVQLLAAGALMAIGVCLHLTEHHSISIGMRQWSTRIRMCTTSTTSTSTRPTIRLASRTPTPIGTRLWSTGTRTPPTCIMFTSTNREKGGRRSRLPVYG
jgi:drug/metabolite transporter (DMT)-like permease